MRILGIDPGPTRSAYVVWDTSDQKIINMSKRIIIDGIKYEHTFPNEYVLTHIKRYGCNTTTIEMPEARGMIVPQTVLDMCRWVGRFEQIVQPLEVELIHPRNIRIHHCGVVASAANVRQALIDRFGKQGTKKEPGILYGVAYDIWDALAVAVCWADKLKEAK